MFSYKAKLTNVRIQRGASGFEVKQVSRAKRHRWPAVVSGLFGFVRKSLNPKIQSGLAWKIIIYGVSLKFAWHPIEGAAFDLKSLITTYTYYITKYRKIFEENRKRVHIFENMYQCSIKHFKKHLQRDWWVQALREISIRFILFCRKIPTIPCTWRVRLFSFT